MRKNRGKVFLIAAAVLLALYFLYPTYKDYQLHSQFKSLHGIDSVQFIETRESEIREARAKRIKLGLDRQGGMRVVLEVNVLKLTEDLGKNKDQTFTEIVGQVREEKLGALIAATMVLCFLGTMLLFPGALRFIRLPRRDSTAS